MCTGKEALAFLSPLSAKPVFTRIMIARLGLISLKWLWWHLQDFSEATLMTFATFSSSSWSPSSAASLLASRAWAKQIISSSEVSIQNMQKNHLPFYSFSPDSLPLSNQKNVLFLCQILVVLMFVRLPSARKLVQLQLGSAEKLLLKLMPETSNAGLLLLLPR